MNSYTNLEIAKMLGVTRTALSAWIRAHKAELPDLEAHITLRGKRTAYDEYIIREICRLRKVEVPAQIAGEKEDVKETPTKAVTKIPEQIQEKSQETVEAATAEPVAENTAAALNPEERIAQLEAENAALKEYLNRYINDFTDQAEAITELLSINGKIKVKKLKKKYAKLLEAKKSEA